MCFSFAKLLRQKQVNWIAPNQGKNSIPSSLSLFGVFIKVPTPRYNETLLPLLYYLLFSRTIEEN